MWLVIGWGSSLKSAKMTFINDTSKYRYPVVINTIKLKTRKVSPHWTSFETFITLTLGGTTKCRNISLVPPPHTEYEPLNNAAVVLICHNLTEILHGGDGDWHEQLAPAGPITVQWGSGLDCMLAKQNVLLVYSRHELYHPLFRISCLYVPNDTGFIHKWQTWHVTVWIMVNNDHCDQCRSKKNF